MTLTDVRLADSARRPLLSVRRIVARYALGPALRLTMGLATTRAVVESCVTILIANYILTQAMLGGEL